MNSVPVITVDGPSGSGKGTIAQGLATELGWHLLDSGAIYRVLALAAEQTGIAANDTARLAALAEALPVTFERAGQGVRAHLKGQDVSDQIRTETCAAGASRLAAIAAVRKALLVRQRDFRAPPGLVADGRDMGSVVFPDAQTKIFLIASPAERAKRRYKQLIEQGINANLGRLEHDIAARDERDAARATAPLLPADDAVVLDSTGLAIQDVLDRALEIARERGLVTGVGT
ncbi:MAG: (d)CMP kinase [Gammaproteobacteria bacterium]|nr:MAG: (d)CMP kinase [Gammaproteobacteria bacterium]